LHPFCVATRSKVILIAERFAMAPPSNTMPERLLSLAEMTNITGQELARRKEMLEFCPEDEERLRKLAHVFLDCANDVIEAFYRHLLSFEEMKAFFPNRELLAQVKNKQKAYFIRLTEGNYDLDYAKERLKIGAIHEQIELPVKFYIIMYSFFLREIWKRIFENDRGNSEEGIEIFFSLMKFTFFDMSLAIDTYIDSRERTIRALQQERIRELFTQALPFRQGMLLLPLIGQIDSQRARQFTEHLLLSIRANRAKVVVIDITGVTTVDSRVANHLIETADAARLMGVKVIFSGISAEIALSMATLGIDLGLVYTVGTLQDGIEYAERLLGYRVEKIVAPRELCDGSTDPLISSIQDTLPNRGFFQKTENKTR